MQPQRIPRAQRAGDDVRLIVLSGGNWCRGGDEQSLAMERAKAGPSRGDRATLFISSSPAISSSSFSCSSDDVACPWQRLTISTIRARFPPRPSHRSALRHTIGYIEANKWGQKSRTRHQIERSRTARDWRAAGRASIDIRLATDV